MFALVSALKNILISLGFPQAFWFNTLILLALDTFKAAIINL